MGTPANLEPGVLDPVSLSPSKAGESSGPGGSSSEPVPSDATGLGRSGLVDQWAHEDLAMLSAQGLVRTLEPLESAQGATVRVGGETVVCFSSNDYLGLAADPSVRAAAAEAIQWHGLGTGASRLVVGDTVVHHELERALAELEGTEAALLFNSGYAANTGVVPALVGEGDVVFSDAWNHASLVDGCRLSKARVVVYPHRDVAALSALVAATPGRRRLVATDAIFSMDGDRAPLRELAALCASEEAALLVDEAHATGVVGDGGQGLSHALGVRPDVVVGTLSKALGAAGAYVASSRKVITLLTSRARPLIFSTALPAAVCAGALAAVERARKDSGLRERLWRNIEAFAAGLTALGLPSHRDSAIFSVVLGTPEAALSASAALRAKGVLVKAIRPPTVPEGTSRLRFSLSAAHSPEQVRLALDALATVYAERSRRVPISVHPEPVEGCRP